MEICMWFDIFWASKKVISFSGHHWCTNIDLAFKANLSPEKTKLLLPSMAYSLRGNHICYLLYTNAGALLWEHQITQMTRTCFCFAGIRKHHIPGVDPFPPSSSLLPSPLAWSGIPSSPSLASLLNNYLPPACCPPQLPYPPHLPSPLLPTSPLLAIVISLHTSLFYVCF